MAATISQDPSLVPTDRANWSGFYTLAGLSKGAAAVGGDSASDPLRDQLQRDASAIAAVPDTSSRRL